MTPDIAQVLAEGGEVTLLPGSYLIELEFARPVRIPILLKVLSGMGWGEVVVDQGQEVGPGPATGALPLAAVAVKAMAPAFAHAAVTKAVASAVAAPRAPSPTTVKITSPANVSPKQMPVVQTNVNLPVSHAAVSSLSTVKAQPSLASALQTQKPIQLPDGRVINAPKPGVSPGLQKFAVTPGLAHALPPALNRAVATAKPSPGLASALAPKPSFKPGLSIPGGGGTPAPIDGGGGGGGAPAAASPSMSDDGGGGGGAASSSASASDGGGDAMDAAATNPDAASTAPADDTPSAMPSIAELWQRWKEWGSPLATGPGQVSTGGVEGEEAVRYRFVGQLTAPLRLQNQSGLSRWLYVHRLTIDPFDALKLQLVPYPLMQGSTYELKFFSRLRSQPTKRAVCEGLAAMGFQPLKLAALRRNMRMPGRQGASVTLWCGIGKWTGPDSLVVADDPFFFETIQEIPS